MNNYLHDIDHRHARDALFSIDPGCNREDWHSIGRAAIAAGLTIDDIDEWSRPASNYSGERDVRAAFRGIEPNGKTGPGTLWKAALSTGWRPPEDGNKAKASATGNKPPGKPPARPQAAPQRPRTGMGAAEVWSRCEPATAAHGYIEVKQGRPDGLRVVPAGDPLRIAGVSVVGWLVVPVVPLAGGVPASLQFIPPPGVGKKLNLPGASVAGVFIVGSVLAGGTVYVCEGIGQAWACWTATGAAAVVCFGWSHVRKVAAQLRQRDASARLVLVPDVGKESEAETIAREVAGQFVTMPEGWPQNTDVNDLAQRDGFDVLEVLLTEPQAPTLPVMRYRLLGSADLHKLPPLAWRVRGVFPAQGLAGIYGPSTSGKSFLALDVAAAIPEGADWFGYRVKAAPVVYCALEGEAGFRLRVAAWEQANSRTLPDGLHLVLQPFKLTEAQDVTDMGAAVLSAGAGVVTILDTLNRAAPEADENASADMGRILEAAKELQRLTGGLVVVVHHTGKDATKGLRGHSSLYAALDAAVEVTREGDRREWKVAKAKDGKDGAGHPFRLEVVDMGEDEDGETITSCVVVPDESPQDATRPRLPKGGNQRLVLDALGELFRKSGTLGRAGAPPQRPCLETESAVEAIAPRLVCEPLRRKERARQALTGLIASGVLTCRDGWLWLP